MSFYICKSAAPARQQQQHSNVKILSKHFNLPLWGGRGVTYYLVEVQCAFCNIGL